MYGRKPPEGQVRAVGRVRCEIWEVSYYWELWKLWEVWEVMRILGGYGRARERVRKRRGVGRRAQSRGGGCVVGGSTYTYWLLSVSAELCLSTMDLRVLYVSASVEMIVSGLSGGRIAI